MLARAAEHWREQPANVEHVQTLLTGVDLGRELPFEPNLWKPQNVYFELMQAAFPALAQQAAEGNDEAELWVAHFLELGEKLGIEVKGARERLEELKQQPAVARLVAELSAS